MKRKYNIVVCPRWELPLKQLNIESGVKFCERELADMSDGKFPLSLLDVDNVISYIRLDILTYLFFIKPEYDSFFQLVKDVSNKKQDIEKILQDVFGELCDLAKKRILVIEKEVREMYEEFKNDNGRTVDEEFGNDVRPALVPVIHKIEESLANFVQTGYNYQHKYIEDKLLRQWKRRKSKRRFSFGRKIQHGILGRVKDKLKQNPSNVMLKSSVPTTQTCPKCGCLTKHSLDKRSYHCSHCGFENPDRDVHSANMIVLLSGYGTYRSLNTDTVSTERMTGFLDSLSNLGVVISTTNSMEACCL